MHFEDNASTYVIKLFNRRLFCVVQLALMCWKEKWLPHGSPELIHSPM